VNNLRFADDIDIIEQSTGLKIVCSYAFFVQLKLENVQSKRNICAVIILTIWALLLGVVICTTRDTGWVS